jgi:hypothetical protein
MKAWGSACALFLATSLTLQPARGGDLNQIRERIAEYFSGAGYQDFQVRAIIRDAEIESRLEPCVVAKTGSHFLFQWLGIRLERLYARAGGRFCPTLDTQLAFADNELKTERQYGCFWRAGSYAQALSALRRGFGRGRC